MNTNSSTRDSQVKSNLTYSRASQSSGTMSTSALSRSSEPVKQRNDKTHNSLDVYDFGDEQTNDIGIGRSILTNQTFWK